MMLWYELKAMSITLYNSLTREKNRLPQQDHIGMYVCGPTVYNRPHIGNARSVVIYDVLFRLLQTRYQQVTYVRNITDVDDKINATAKAHNMTIRELTEKTVQQFHSDMNALYCLAPTIEPRATEHISHIITMIDTLMLRNHAYLAEGHVLFDVDAVNTHPTWKYGILSGRNIEEQQAGARIAVESYKRNAGDFILWKPALVDDDASSVFDSPWGPGRPGWHIECSAMSTHYLGTDFDIHGGGADLKFPHHENEMAQSCCAHPDSSYAKHWMHNGFLTVSGEKMSKSLGNFITVHELLERGVKGEVIRLALLSAHYAKPLDWNDKLLSDCEKQLDKLYRKMNSTPQKKTCDPAFLKILHDDLNVPAAMAYLHHMDSAYLCTCGQMLGLLQDASWGAAPQISQDAALDDDIRMLIEERKAAKADKNWSKADDIRDALKKRNIELIDMADGTTQWKQTVI